MSRTVAVLCPDWPFVAAGLDGEPAAVLRRNRVVACSATARAEGIRLHQRRREAEAACPDVTFVKEDPGRDVRAFEPVVASVSSFSPFVEVTRPGLCSLPARGPSRYFGGEERLGALLSEAASKAVAAIAGGAPACRVGVADTPFAARLAARCSTLVPPGETAAWLSGLPVGVLPLPAVVELLTRLGVHHLGELAEMDEGVVSARFGAEGARAHRLARGEDDDRLALVQPPPELSVQRELDDPVDQVDTAAFLAAAAADELSSRLAARGLACTRLLVEASTEHAEELSRWWRTDGQFTARAMVDRVRWQLEGWLAPPGRGAAAGSSSPTAGITLLRLSAGEVAPDCGRQLGLFGEPADAGQRVERAAARVQGLLGHDSIGTAVLAGGRGQADQASFLPWGEPREVPPGDGSGKPWPGRLPPPAPPVVYDRPTPVSLRDPSGRPVEVSGRGRLSGPPATLFSGPGRESAVTGWAGPWPLDERWWDPALHRRRARMQVALEDGSAHVLTLESGRWGIEATFD